MSHGTCFSTRCLFLLLLQIQNRPLTRYLPVRGDEDQFDLRAHIESSGHQLELCPHVIVTKTTARGFLSKLGSRFHNWNKRWFVFDRETRALTYYADKNEKKSKPRGGVHFQVRKYNQPDTFVILLLYFRLSHRILSLNVESLHHSMEHYHIL